MTPDLGSRVDVHHNFFRQEEHFGTSVWVHRKGAISAALGERAPIPGSMGTASYVVEGLGEPSSFRSGSHGAGRVMTRKEARARLRTEKLVHTMRRVVFDARRAASLVEEAPEAYRDIREVLEEEADLVRLVVRLEPIAVLKGGLIEPSTIDLTRNCKLEEPHATSAARARCNECDLSVVPRS